LSYKLLLIFNAVHFEKVNNFINNIFLLEQALECKKYTTGNFMTSLSSLRQTCQYGQGIQTRTMDTEVQ